MKSINPQAHRVKPVVKRHDSKSSHKGLGGRDQANSRVRETHKEIIRIQMREYWKVLLNKNMDLSVDSLAEIVSYHGYHCIKLFKLDQACFLLTFLEKEDVHYIVWEDLKIWVKSYTKASMQDLIQPRIALIQIKGYLF